MLQSLLVNDVVLIDRLELDFEPGLCVLTGETGAGKSILLDALGLALGMRASPALIRPGASRAGATAAFSLAADHPVRTLLRQQDLEEADDSDNIILRRAIAGDGRSRAWINDRPVTAGLLRQVGDLLVEIQGQAEQHGLLDPAGHAALLDASAGLGDTAAAVAVAWQAWRQAEKSLREATGAREQAAREEEFLRHATDELDRLAPEDGEEARLAGVREMLRHREQVVEALNTAREAIAGQPGASEALQTALRALASAAPRAGGRLDPPVEALERALLELEEVSAGLAAAGDAVGEDGASLADIEDRLFALRDIARKHQVSPDGLPALREKLAADLAAIDQGGDLLTRLTTGRDQARAAYIAAADDLGAARREAALRLDAAVALELPPLHLGDAVFVTALEPLPEAEWGPGGSDRVVFLAATIPGAAPGPLGRVASGGELSRFMLALKVVLARAGSAPTLVFDEVDSGVGGATAHAVGQRLARLGEDLQVLVVTHSPQVAARGESHLRVVKAAGEDGLVTSVAPLAVPERREEIARMLSGQDITDEARAAADRLLAGDSP